MLEEQSLLLLPWAPRPIQPAPSTQLRRSILATFDRRHLGYAGQRRCRFARLGWLFPPVLEVCETEDESLLCSLRPGWRFGSCKVRDADGHIVGRLRGQAILDQFNQLFATIKAGQPGGKARFVAPDGTELGYVAFSPEGSCLTFGPAIQSNPFAKMMLLAAVLREQRP